MTQKNARLGVIGGMGPQATQVFYQRILDRTEAVRDQEHLPALILSDTEMPDRTEAILSGRGEEVFVRLLDDARLLERGGCTAIAIPCNTSHYFAARLARELSIPLLNMVEETAKAAARAGRRRVGILATEGTVRTELYQNACRAAGVEAILPDAQTQELVTAIIYDQIKRGEMGSRETFSAIDRALRAAGCDGAILGCTELSVYRAYHGLPDFYLDAMEILAETCITFCGKRLRPM